MPQNLEQIANHLEFLGFAIEKTPGKDDVKPMLVAKSDKEPTLVIIELSPGWTFFRSNFGINKAASTAMDTAINKLSGVSDVVNPHYVVEDGKVTLRFDASYTGNYSKDVFGKFISNVLSDIKKMYRIPDVFKVFED